ncbi:MAG: hypothetical protein CW716_11905, partial [Candidatus Bathyarchaeum sp.]
MLKPKKVSLLVLLMLLLTLTLTPIMGAYATIPPGEDVIPPSQLPEPTQGSANIIIVDTVGGTT